MHGAKSIMVPASSITDAEWDEILATGGEIYEYDEKEDAVTAFAMLNECADHAMLNECADHVHPGRVSQAVLPVRRPVQGVRGVPSIMDVHARGRHAGQGLGGHVRS